MPISLRPPIADEVWRSDDGDRAVAGTDVESVRVYVWTPLGWRGAPSDELAASILGELAISLRATLAAEVLRAERAEARATSWRTRFWSACEDIAPEVKKMRDSIELVIADFGDEYPARMDALRAAIGDDS